MVQMHLFITYSVWPNDHSLNLIRMHFFANQPFFNLRLGIAFAAFLNHSYINIGLFLKVTGKKMKARTKYANDNNLNLT